MDEFTQSHSLEVISFTSKCITREICKRLSDLNYLYSVTDAAGRSLEQKATGDDTLVILLSGALQNKSANLLNRINTPCLTIFCDPSTEWDHRILQLSADFCSWPCKEHELDLRLKNVLSKSRINLKDFSQSIDDQCIDLNLIGSCPEFLEIKELIQKCAVCDAPILIEGETGTGKEVVARAIHSLSSRRSYPFVPVNCGALPDTLIENELFGHEKGAYTDAKCQQIGLIAQADGGTIFLDEVECLSPKGQASLLRYTENQEYKSLGGTRRMKSNVRIITASNIPLAKLIALDRFRQDLFFRLNLITLTLPALKTRGDDLDLLTRHFMQRYGVRYAQPNRCLDSKTLTWMSHYNWPGNVRELENFIHRQFLLNDKVSDGEADKRERDEAFSQRRKTPDRRQTIAYDMSFQAAKNKIISSFEQRYLTNLIAKTQGNVTLAAKLARMERRAVGKLLIKHGIDKNLYKK